MAVSVNRSHFFINIECFYEFKDGSFHPPPLHNRKVIAMKCDEIRKPAVVGVVPALWRATQPVLQCKSHPGRMVWCRILQPWMSLTRSKFRIVSITAR